MENAIESLTRVRERTDATAVAPRGNDADALRAAAHEFEAYMLKLILSELRRTAGSGGLFPEGSLAGYRAMLDDALARHAAEAGSFGLARQLLERWEADR